MRGLRVATAFLTRVPTLVAVDHPSDLTRSLPWFPVVGAGVGLIVGGILALAAPILPPLVAGALALAAGLMVTGAFHEDGLADTFDALPGRRTPAERHSIMRDPRLGTFGVAALTIALLIRVALYAAVAPIGPLAILIAVHALSRGLVAGVMMFVVAARPDGLGAAYLEAAERRYPLVAMLVGVAIATPLLGMLVIPTLLIGIVGAGLIAIWSYRKIGGVTGDVLGACQQVAELAALAVLAVGLS